MKHKHAKGAFGGQRKADKMAEVSIPDDIKTDIAKVVRSIDWRDSFPEGGLCFHRAVTGWLVLTDLGIKATPTLGGMVYRAGPDEYRDCVAFCGPGNAGCSIDGHFLGHYWILSHNDFIDFSVGDWRETCAAHNEYTPDGMVKLDPIQWTAPELPDFFWDNQSSFTGKGRTPELGKAWYTGFDGDANTKKEFGESIKDLVPTLKDCRRGHLLKAYKHYALKERLFAAREGHTAIRLSQLAKITGDADMLERCIQSGEDQLIVLRGKQEITEEAAIGILLEMVR